MTARERALRIGRAAVSPEDKDPERPQEADEPGRQVDTREAPCAESPKAGPVGVVPAGRQQLEFK